MSDDEPPSATTASTKLNAHAQRKILVLRLAGIFLFIAFATGILGYGAIDGIPGATLEIICVVTAAAWVLLAIWAFILHGNERIMVSNRATAATTPSMPRSGRLGTLASTVACLVLAAIAGAIGYGEWSTGLTQSAQAGMVILLVLAGGLFLWYLFDPRLHPPPSSGA